MNLIKSTVFKLLFRHALGFAGGWLIKTGIMSDADQQTAWGAVLALAAILHSLWDKRALIQAELQGFESTTLANPLKVLAMAFGLAVLFTGCKSEQMVTNESGSGFKGHVMVPIPGSSTALIDLGISVGTFKSTSVIQPTATNAIFTPSLAVAADTEGAENLTGNVGTGTNATAGITAGQKDRYLLVTGDTVATDNPNTNHVMRLDGYQGFNPLLNTNK